MSNLANTTASHISFGLTRFLSWVSLGLILVSCLALAVFIGNMARQTLLERQQQYALLIAENLNHQVYRRFTLPTFLSFGRIALRMPVQYERLDEVVQSTIHGLHIDTLRIFGADTIVNYSINNDDVGKEGLAPPDMERIFEQGGTRFETLTSTTIWRAMFMFDLPERAFVLRTIFPLRVEIKPRENNEPAESIVTGVLVITQDITSDYDTVIRFQWLLIATCLGTSAVLFAFLQFFIMKAERLIAERMLRTRALEKELHDNEKLVSMGRVIASIAHEIRNPLGIIRSSAELLSKRAALTQSANTPILTAIYDESCRLSQTVNDFLDYARPRTPKHASVDCALLLDQAFGFLQGEFAKHKVEIVTHIVRPLPVLGDKDLLYRALYNILINALQAMEDGGILRVRGVRTPDNKVLVEVHDSGSGFPPNAMQSVLEPFFTTKDHGTGLGLPIVNTIIVSHNGTLECANALSGGAVVRVYLPLAPDALPLSMNDTAASL